MRGQEYSLHRLIHRDSKDSTFSIMTKAVALSCHIQGCEGSPLLAEKRPLKQRPKFREETPNRAKQQSLAAPQQCHDRSEKSNSEAWPRTGPLLFSAYCVADLH